MAKGLAVGLNAGYIVSKIERPPKVKKSADKRKFLLI